MTASVLEIPDFTSIAGRSTATAETIRELKIRTAVMGKEERKRSFARGRGEPNLGFSNRSAKNATKNATAQEIAFAHATRSNKGVLVLNERKSTPDKTSTHCSNSSNKVGDKNRLFPQSRPRKTAKSAEKIPPTSKIFKVGKHRSSGSRGRKRRPKTQRKRAGTKLDKNAINSPAERVEFCFFGLFSALKRAIKRERVTGSPPAPSVKNMPKTEACRLYSSEIEYNEESVEIIIEKICELIGE